MYSSTIHSNPQTGNYPNSYQQENTWILAQSSNEIQHSNENEWFITTCYISIWIKGVGPLYRHRTLKQATWLSPVGSEGCVFSLQVDGNSKECKRGFFGAGKFLILELGVGSIKCISCIKSHWAFHISVILCIITKCKKTSLDAFLVVSLLSRI